MCGKELLQLFPNSPQSSTCRCTAARSSADRYSSCTHSHARPSGARRGVETIEAVHSWGPHAPPMPAGHAPASSRSRLRNRWHRGNLATGRSTLRRQASSAAAAPLQTSLRRGPRASPSFPKCQSFLKCGKKNSTPAHSAGFEPARGDPKRFLVSRLNRSATSAERASRVN